MILTKVFSLQTDKLCSQIAELFLTTYFNWPS